MSLEEIENSAWFGEPRDTALAGLVDALNAAAGSTRVGVRAVAVRRPAAAARPAGRHPHRIHLPVGGGLPGRAVGRARRRLGPGQPFSIAREPLAQGFKKAGATDDDAFLVVANHVKSKGAGTPLYPGDEENTSPASDQGAFNATRIREAQDLNAFAARVAASLKTDRVFLAGDFNAYTHEDPMEEGSIDHVLANPGASSG